MDEEDSIQKYKDKWAPILNGLEGDALDKEYQKAMMDSLIKDQIAYFESLKDEKGELPVWMNYGLSLVRAPRLYYENNWISIQPMSGPISSIFFMDVLNKNKKLEQPKSLLAPDCIPCGGEGGKHKLGCPVNKP